MKQHTTLGHVATVARSLGLDPNRLVSPYATDEELADAKEMSDMAAHLNRIEDDYEQSQPRAMTAEEMAAVYRAGYVTTVHVLGEAAPEVRTSHGNTRSPHGYGVSLRETSVAARQAGNMYDAGNQGTPATELADGEAPGPLAGLKDDLLHKILLFHRTALGGPHVAETDAAGQRAALQKVTAALNDHIAQRAGATHAESARVAVFEALGIREAAAMDAGAPTTILDGLLDAECNLYGNPAGKRVISADDKREAVAAVAKMLGEHIGHLDQVQTKYTGGATDAEVRQSATVTNYLERRGYVGQAIPLREDVEHD